MLRLKPKASEKWMISNLLGLEKKICKPKEEDDNDFHLNYHPNQMIGYKGVAAAFEIPTVK